MPQSPILIIDHVEQGQSQKEVTVNEATDILERKITTASNIDVAGGPGDVDLTNDQVRDMRLEFSGILTGDVTVTVPARNMMYMLKNLTTGAFALDFEVVGGAAANIVLDRNYVYWVWCDGVDIFDITRELLDYVTDVATTYTATGNDRKVNADTTGGAFTITLPQAAPGKELLITSIGAATQLDIARGGADTIKGVATNITITTQWQAVLFVGESATNWLAFRLTVA
jgi:hypothetical protein